MKDINQERNPLDLTEIETKWKDIESSYRKEHPTLTEEDVNYREGEFDDMVHRIARRTNRSRELVLEDIKNWQDKNSI